MYLIEKRDKIFFPIKETKNKYNWKREVNEN